MHTDIRALDARAVRASIAVVTRVSEGDLRRPTPCSAWRLADLLAHMTEEHNAFAVAAGAAASPTGGDPVAAYRVAAEGVVAAFGADGVLEREFSVPGANTEVTFPAGTAIGFHFIDYLVHTWDVARALGVGFAPEPDLVDAALPIAAAVPDGDYRRLPGSVFAPRVAVPADVPAWDRVLAMLGRSPDWSSPDAEKGRKQPPPGVE
jgi:uncharacterized protein (TIGR03086 family)